MKYVLAFLTSLLFGIGAAHAQSTPFATPQECIWRAESATNMFVTLRMRTNHASNFGNYDYQQEANRVKSLKISDDEMKKRIRQVDHGFLVLRERINSLMKNDPDSVTKLIFENCSGSNK